MISYYKKDFNDMLKPLGLVTTALAVTGVAAKISYSETNDSKLTSDQLAQLSLADGFIFIPAITLSSDRLTLGYVEQSGKDKMDFLPMI